MKSELKTLLIIATIAVVVIFGWRYYNSRKPDTKQSSDGEGAPDDPGTTTSRPDAIHPDPAVVSSRTGDTPNVGPRRKTDTIDDMVKDDIIPVVPRKLFVLSQHEQV